MAVDIFEKFLSSSIIKKFLVSLKVKKRKRLSAKLFLFWLIFLYHNQADNLIQKGSLKKHYGNSSLVLR